MSSEYTSCYNIIIIIYYILLYNCSLKMHFFLPILVSISGQEEWSGQSLFFSKTLNSEWAKESETSAIIWTEKCTFWKKQNSKIGWKSKRRVHRAHEMHNCYFTIKTNCLKLEQEIRRRERVCSPVGSGCWYTIFIVNSICTFIFPNKLRSSKRSSLACCS